MKPNRQSIRLRGYDYSAEGAYFVTIVCKDRVHWFGDITDGEMHLSDAGRIIEEEWLRGAELRSEVSLDAYVVMPNHFHGIVVIGEPLIPLAGRGVWIYAQNHNETDNSNHQKGMNLNDTMGLNSNYKKGVNPYAPTAGLQSPKRSLGSLVRAFKAGCSARIRQTIATEFTWQRNFHDRIIRNQEELQKIQNYIQNNPSLWNEDMFNQ